MNIAQFKKILVSLQNFLVIRLTTRGFRKHLNFAETSRLGSDYGGWVMPDRHVSFGGGTLISIGIGKDVTFDKALAKSGFEIIAADVIKNSCDFAIKELSEFSAIQIHNLGLAHFCGYANFLPPTHQNHDSWSMQPLNRKVSQGAKFEVVTLECFLKKNLHSGFTRPLILKIDIEGAEQYVMPDIINSSTKFDVVAIELDFLSLLHFNQIWLRLRNIRIMRLLLKEFEKSGYKLISIDGFNWTWTVINE